MDSDIVLSASLIIVKINVLKSTVSGGQLELCGVLVLLCPTVPEGTRGRWEPIAGELAPERTNVELKRGEQRSGGEKLTGTGVVLSATKPAEDLNERADIIPQQLSEAARAS